MHRAKKVVTRLAALFGAPQSGERVRSPVQEYATSSRLQRARRAHDSIEAQRSGGARRREARWDGHAPQPQADAPECRRCGTWTEEKQKNCCRPTLPLSRPSAARSASAEVLLVQAEETST